VPNHGRWGTAAEIILGEARRVEIIDELFTLNDKEMEELRTKRATKRLENFQEVSSVCR
jgi:hypothetical protein